MTAIVFVGPSLPEEARPGSGGIVYRGPARQGDIYMSLRDRPTVIGLIDGYFDAVPSVWHKEILWAMTKGVHVLGASSMGALRAAELDSFGMEGIGGVYEDYRDGVLEDDDDVAVLHGPAELGYRSLTIAMVTVRATLSALKTIDYRAREAVGRAAKSLGYWERTPSRIEEEALRSGVSPDVAGPIAAALRSEPVDVKRRDADALVRLLIDRRDEFDARKTVRFTFNETVAWRTFIARLDGERADRRS